MTTRNHDGERPPSSPLDALHAAVLVVGAFRRGALGPASVPEDDEPEYFADEDRWAFLALVTSVNYRRNSARLWADAKAAYENPETRWIFEPEAIASASDSEVHDALTGTRVAIQPTRQVPGWRTIARNVHKHWGSFQALVLQQPSFEALRHTVQVEFRSSFPYLAGPKLFSYWAYTMQRKGMTAFPDAELIDVAVDSHVMKSSSEMRLPSALRGGTPTDVANEWREVLDGSSIIPTDLTIPLWIWSRAGFSPSLTELQDFESDSVRS